ncbi:hypothetical protein IQ238_27195, partial [Pleurocapsales cyanobacterium LEGE 06147]|nr:hypothetical protein [Pleurocapsales cyanobacterium LEGE 06147]
LSKQGGMAAGVVSFITNCFDVKSPTGKYFILFSACKLFKYRYQDLLRVKTGFARNAVLGVANRPIDAVKQGKIRLLVKLCGI